MSRGIGGRLSENEKWRHYQSAFYSLMTADRFSLRALLQAVSPPQRAGESPSQAI